MAGNKGGDGEPIIIIRKKKKRTGGGSHGNTAWKIAYADFVTAMMAFFLLMWLLNVTTQEQREGIADMFDPMSTQSSEAGQDLFSGESLKDTQGDTNDGGIEFVPPMTQSRQNSGESETQANGEEAAQFVADEIRREMDEAGILQDLGENVRVDRVPDGVRIRIVDGDGFGMFQSGSSILTTKAADLVGAVGGVLKRFSQEIVVVGHTDAEPYSGNGDYTNWELSADRAGAARVALRDSGVEDQRFARNEGHGDANLMLPERPLAPENRRISIILLDGTGDGTGDLDSLQGGSGRRWLNVTRP